MHQADLNICLFLLQVCVGFHECTVPCISDLGIHQLLHQPSHLYRPVQALPVWTRTPLQADQEKCSTGSEVLPATTAGPSQPASPGSGAIGMMPSTTRTIDSSCGNVAVNMPQNHGQTHPRNNGKICSQDGKICLNNRKIYPYVGNMAQNDEMINQNVTEDSNC